MANQYFVDTKFTTVEFSVEEPSYHHIFTVMRAQEGDKFEVIFSDDKVGLVEVVQGNQLKLIREIDRITELPIEVTVAVGFPKADKLDFIVEKSTELGAATIWAAPFDWSVVKWNSEKLAKKQEKLSKIARGAAEQSRRLKIPSIELFERQTDLIARFQDFDRILIAYEEAAKKGETSSFVDSLSQGPAKVLLIFGPEGGISPKEISLFESGGAKKVGLGPRILRAETAPLYALSAISALLELQKI